MSNPNVTTDDMLRAALRASSIPAPVTQWEYHTEPFASREFPPGLLTRLGLEGWELAAVCDGRAYFKRPVVAGAPQEGK